MITKENRRSVGLAAVLIAAVAVGLSACSGGGAGHDPAHVASLGTNGGSRSHGHESTTTTATAGNPTQLMDEWATCMRSNGDPNQTDPTIDSHGVINIILPLGVNDNLSSEVHGSTGPCSNYELAAENALRAGQDDAGITQDQSVQFTNCMRANGVPNYPDPGSNGKTDFNGTGVDPNSPFVENATKVCGKKLGFPNWWINGWGPPGDVSVQSAGIGPNGPQPCATAARGSGGGCVAGGNGAPVRVPTTTNSGSGTNG